MGSYALKTTLVMMILDGIFNFALALCFKTVFDLDQEQTHAFYQVLFYWL